MRIKLHRKFEKQYEQLGKKDRARVKERLALFSHDEFDPILNNHPLRGKYAGYRSINIDGDLRALYRRQSGNTAFFVRLGTHSELYE